MSQTLTPSTPGAAASGRPFAPAADGVLRQFGDPTRRPPPGTIPQMVRETLRKHPKKTAMLYKKGNAWHPILFEEMEARIRNLALGLLSLGVQPGDRVAILAENRPEWALTDLAALFLGAATVPLYSTLPPAQVQYILADSRSRLVVCSHEKQLAKVLEVRDRLPELATVVVIDPPETMPEGVLTLAEVEERGRVGDAALLDELSARVQPGDLATIIYTSGTTGEPKGAMLTHDNFVSNASAVATLVDVLPHDTFLSFLPLSHVFERMAGHYLPLRVGATVAYAESIFTVQTNMVEIKPTVMASVPRLYEAFHSRILDALKKQPENRRRLAEWAIGIGKQYHCARIQGERPPFLASLLYPIADSLVLRSMRERITGGRLRYFISGGAPLPLATAEFLTAIGLHILEGYGLTETAPVICVNRPSRTKLGTVGPPIDGVEVRIAEDGEILSRGPHIMLGYFGKPEETAKAINSEGWFHTGDIGKLDEEGYLRITDRKKDIIVLANGKNVAPQPIEARLKSSPYIGNVVLFGDREPQIVALIVPDFDALRRWAREKGMETRDTQALLQNPEVKKLYRAELESLSKDLADFETVKRFALLPRDFSQEHDELTPTLKIKRRVVAEHFADELKALFG